MSYIIIDKQQEGTHQGETFETLKEVKAHLIGYHTGYSEATNEGTKSIKNMSLIDLCDFGDWEIQEVTR